MTFSHGYQLIPHQQMHIGIKPYEQQQKKNPMNVMNVGRHLVMLQHLFNVREFILVRNPVNVKNVGRPLLMVEG